jgi:hypothetical protein
MLEIEEHTDMEVESVALCTETSHIQNVVAQFNAQFWVFFYLFTYCIWNSVDVICNPFYLGIVMSVNLSDGPQISRLMAHRGVGGLELAPGELQTL